MLSRSPASYDLFVTEQRASMSLRRAAAWSLLDQVLLSAVHFGVGLAVLRLSDKADYGVYVIGWSLLLLLAGLQNAFVTTQMTLRTAGLSQPRSVQAAFLVGQFLLYAPLAATMLAVAAWCAAFFPGSRHHAVVAVVIVVAFAGVSLREFVRNGLFAAGAARQVFLIDAVYATTLALVTAACALWLPRSELGIAALLALGGASAVAAATTLRDLLPLCTWRSGRQALRDNSNNGLWAAGGVAVTHFQSQAYIYVLSLFSGPTTTAEANAARLLLMPISLALTSLQRVLYPRWIALVRAGDHAALRSLSRHTAAALTVVVILYALALDHASRWLIAGVLGPEYGASGAYLFMFSALVWSEAMRTLAALRLQANARFKDITVANALTVAPVLIVAAALMRYLGPHTAAWAQIAGDIALALLLLRAARTESRR